MDLAWFCALGVGVCNSVIAVVGKAAERTHCRASMYSLVLFAVAAGTALAIALAGGGVDWRDWRLWCYGMVMGGAYLAVVVVTLRANRRWPPSVVWAAANAAFVVPILVSLPLLGEPLKLLDAPILAGIGLMMVGLVDKRAVGAEGKAPGASALMCWFLMGAVFAINGLLMVGFKLFSQVVPAQPSSGLVVVTYGSAAVLALAMHVRQGTPRLGWHELGCGLGGGLLFGLAALALLGAMQLPAGAAFPVVQGVSLVGGMLLCAMIFREPLTLRKTAALAVGIVAMVLTVWR